MTDAWLQYHGLTVTEGVTEAEGMVGGDTEGKGARDWLTIAAQVST